ncbi:hypothetical protein M419DRAFT_132224 [Trichoderma reesei RUT C-30]|uniref:Uncharacterized protein n=2 Tax=Hypocrea jecorina TaxID=51453 RepID=A0A024S675_HYPJR|nr:hypothetical protein M419DRAFT_132224 [Trichoderma reesei RUT C-30]
MCPKQTSLLCSRMIAYACAAKGPQNPSGPTGSRYRYCQNLTVHFGAGWVQGKKARHLLTRAQPQYSGKHYLEAKVSISNPFYPTLAALDFATNRPVNLAEGGGEAARNLFVTDAEFFGTWGSLLKNIITNSAGAFRAWPLYHMPSSAPSWASAARVTVIGDAAYLRVDSLSWEKAAQCTTPWFWHPRLLSAA